MENRRRWRKVCRMADRVRYEAPHAHQVVRLSLRLFAELQPVHGLSDNCRFPVSCGALLHDIGCAEGRKSHHKTALRYIMNSPLLPFSRDERLIVGSIARYHRRALPSSRHWHYDELTAPDQKMVRLLGGIVRLADGLDRSHRNLVDQVTCETAANQVLVTCDSRDVLPLSRDAASDKSSLLERALGRRILIFCRPTSKPQFTLGDAERTRDSLSSHKRVAPGASRVVVPNEPPAVADRAVDVVTRAVHGGPPLPCLSAVVAGR